MNNRNINLTGSRSSRRIIIILAAVLLALFVMACSCNLSLPVTRIKTGSIQGVDIQIPLPEDPSAGAELTLDFMGGELELAPGASGYLASGTATFNVAEFEPRVESAGSAYTLTTGDRKIEGLPVFKDDFKNEWDLQLANIPLRLNIKAGAYNGSFELGGLSLEKLAIMDGGADVTAKFSAPNNVDMSTFTYATGASDAELRGLANANFEQMSFTSGAGNYTLSFDGELQRDANVTVDSGLGAVTIIIPEGVNARLTLDGLASVNTSGGWAQDDNTYTLSGSGPSISIKVKMGAGTLNLKTE